MTDHSEMRVPIFMFIMMAVLTIAMHAHGDPIYGSMFAFLAGGFATNVIIGRAIGK